ncbi:class I SAM-dependent methyltransferase [bacterium]|nr:class I SAM-dependent methyltransferase [bacterium]
MSCKICNSQLKYVFLVRILNKYEVKCFYCINCGFLQTEEPYWLKEAYNSPINISDTGYMQRNIYLSKTLTTILSVFFNPNGRFVDYAGGYGVFVRLMRDIGFDFYWQDKYTQNLFASGFEWKDKEKVEAVTSFESFEHFVTPMEETSKMLSISRSIIFTTELLSNPIPKIDEWWYYGLNHGQHISFYSEKTLQYIANYFGLKYIHSGSLHIFTEKEIYEILLKFLIKLNKFGLYKILCLKLKSKTWEDYLKIKQEVSK